MEILYRANDTKIAKGTTDPGVDCFNQINNLKNHATYSEATQSFSHHKITPDIAVTNTGQKKKQSHADLFSLVGLEGMFGKFGWLSLILFWCGRLIW